MKIKSTRHTVYQIAYHLVWVTKYRRAVLDETVQARLKTLLPEIAGEHGCEVVEIEAMPEHVHCFVSAPPKVAPSTVVKILKGASARKLFTEFPYLQNQLWKGHLWHPSSYIGTAGNVSAETIKRYIQNQPTKG